MNPLYNIKSKCQSSNDKGIPNDKYQSIFSEFKNLPFEFWISFEI